MVKYGNGSEHNDVFPDREQSVEPALILLEKNWWEKEIIVLPANGHGAVTDQRLVSSIYTSGNWALVEFANNYHRMGLARGL